MKLVVNLLSWKFLAFISIVCVVYFAVTSFSLFPVTQAEILRLNSPDGTFDAVYIQSGAGAMASGNYLVYVVPKGRQPNNNDIAVFWGKRTFDLSLSWEEKRKLLIQFDKSDVKHFQNYIYPFPQDGRYKIEIEYKQIKPAI